MSIRKAISQAVAEVESEISKHTETFADEHYYLHYVLNQDSVQDIPITRNLDMLLQFRAYLKGYTDSPVDDSLYFYGVMRLKAAEYLNGWKNIRDIRNLLAVDGFISDPDVQFVEMGKLCSVDPVAYYAVHVILQVIKRNPNVNLATRCLWDMIPADGTLAAMAYYEGE